MGLKAVCAILSWSHRSDTRKSKVRGLLGTTQANRSAVQADTALGSQGALSDNGTGSLYCEYRATL